MDSLTDGQRLEPLTRTANIARAGLDEEARTVELSFSSEAPVNRWFGREVLDHGGNSADLTRLNDGGAVLFEHDPTQQIGVVESARIDGDRTGRATIRFGRSAKAQEVWQDIQDGIRSKVSFGYRIREAEIEEKSEELGDLYRATSWEALEISTVSIPADPSVGVGRSESTGNGDPVKLSDHTSNPDMDTTQQPADEAAQDKVRSVAAEPSAPPTIDLEATRREERDRIREINAIGTRFDLPEGTVANAISEGVSLDDFRARVVSDFKPAPAAPEPSHEIGLNKDERRTFSLRKAILDVRTGRGLEGLEKEVSDATADQLDLERSDLAINLPFDVTGHGQRDLEVGTAAEGGNVVQTDLGSMIELLRNRMVVIQAGATSLTGLRGNLSLPKQDGAATASFVDEEGSVTETAQSFAQLALVPHRLAARTVYSDQLLRQSSIDIENFIREDLMRVTAIELDLQAIHGDGGATEPEGIENATGVNSVTFGATATWAKALEFEELIAVDNADVDGMTWITTPEVRGAWKAIERATNTARFLWADDNTVNGYRALVSNQVESDKVVFGNFRDMFLASWGGMSVIVDPYSKAQTGQCVLTVNSFHDVGIRHAESFAISADSGDQ